MRKLGIALGTIVAFATTAIANSPAEARNGRNAAIGFGLAAGAIGASAAATSVSASSRQTFACFRNLTTSTIAHSNAKLID